MFSTSACPKSLPTAESTRPEHDGGVWCSIFPETGEFRLTEALESHGAYGSSDGIARWALCRALWLVVAAQSLTFCSFQRGVGHGGARYRRSEVSL